MKKGIHSILAHLPVILIAAACGSSAKGNKVAPTESDDATSIVYFTREITPEREMTRRPSSSASTRATASGFSPGPKRTAWDPLITKS